MAKLHKGLGRGLDALLSGGNSEKDEVMRDLNIAQLKPGKYQPRSHMDEHALHDLAASIKAQGVMQPILVRQLEDNGYEIIAGERRWRAAKMAGLTHVPVLVRSVPDNAALAMALIENIQRSDLLPLETAEAYRSLSDDFGLTHEEIAARVGKSRVAVTNTLRLLKLPDSVRAMLRQAFAGWAPSLTYLIESGDFIAVRPLYALPIGHTWRSRPGVTLLGDAAHLMSPFSGEGVNLALADAVDLADALISAQASAQGSADGWSAEGWPAVAACEAAIMARATPAAEGAAEGLNGSISSDGVAAVLDHYRQRVAT